MCSCLSSVPQICRRHCLCHGHGIFVLGHDDGYGHGDGEPISNYGDDDDDDDDDGDDADDNDDDDHDDEHRGGNRKHDDHDDDATRLTIT